MKHQFKFSPLPFDQIALDDFPVTPRIFKNARMWRWKGLIPQYYNLWIALSGKGEMITSGRAYPIRKGVAFILCPGQSVEAYSLEEAGVENFAVHFYPMKKGRKMQLPRDFLLSGHQVREFQFVQELIRHCVACGQFSDPLSTGQVKQDVMAALQQLFREKQSPLPAPSDVKIQSLMDDINETPSGRWTIEEMSRRTGLSASQVTRRFLALSGKSPNRFVVHARVTHACLMLRETSFSVEKLAEGLGYSDLFFFSKQFKQWMGIPPSQYRAQYRI